MVCRETLPLADLQREPCRSGTDFTAAAAVANSKSHTVPDLFKKKNTVPDTSSGDHVSSSSFTCAGGRPELVESMSRGYVRVRIGGALIFTYPPLTGHHRDGTTPCVVVRSPVKDQPAGREGDDRDGPRSNPAAAS